MKTPSRSNGRLLYTEYDRIVIPQDIPELGVEKGAEGVVRGLHRRPDGVHASVMVTYSTNQPRGLVDMQVAPEEKVASYTEVASYTVGT